MLASPALPSVSVSVSFSTVARAKDVPRRYRRRLEPIRARHSAFVVDVIAVKIGGIEPLPSELITPAHRAVCTSPDAVREVEEARLADLLQGRHHEREYTEEDVPDEPEFGPAMGQLGEPLDQ